MSNSGTAAVAPTMLEKFVTFDAGTHRGTHDSKHSKAVVMTRIAEHRIECSSGSWVYTHLSTTDSSILIRYLLRWTLSGSRRLPHLHTMSENELVKPSVVRVVLGEKSDCF